MCRAFFAPRTIGVVSDSVALAIVVFFGLAVLLSIVLLGTKSKDHPQVLKLLVELLQASSQAKTGRRRRTSKRPDSDDDRDSSSGKPKNHDR